MFDLLTGFKKDFTTFMENIESAQKQVDTVGRTLATATKRNEIIMKKLNKAETLSIPEIEESE